jgi:hypothetical protein
MVVFAHVEQVITNTRSDIVHRGETKGSTITKMSNYYYRHEVVIDSNPW